MSKYSIKAEFHFPDRQKATIAFKAVSPDITKKHKRSQTKLVLKDSALMLSVQALDATALRASFNSAAKHIAFSNEIAEKFAKTKEV